MESALLDELGGAGWGEIKALGAVAAAADKALDERLVDLDEVEGDMRR